jgi:oxygen-independent coproporphyrinogen-3 oxidase
MQSEHLSSYEVIYEEDTALYAQLEAGEFDVDEELACAMYEELVNRAQAAGFCQYEVANFAKDGKKELETGDAARLNKQGAEVGAEPGSIDQTPGVPTYACRHNVNYWRGGSFYGLGPSATSYVRGVRTKNWSNTQLYCEQVEHGQRAFESREELAPLPRAGETAAFGLRMLVGWPFQQFAAITGHDLRQNWASDMERLKEQGWGEISGDRFRLTAQGLRFADAAAQLFLR